MGRKKSGLPAALMACSRVAGPIRDAAASELRGLFDTHKTADAVSAALGISDRHLQRLEVALGIRAKSERHARAAKAARQKAPNGRAEHPAQPWCSCNWCVWRRDQMRAA